MLMALVASSNQQFCVTTNHCQLLPASRYQSPISYARLGTAGPISVEIINVNFCSIYYLIVEVASQMSDKPGRLDQEAPTSALTTFYKHCYVV